MKRNSLLLLTFFLFLVKFVDAQVSFGFAWNYTQTLNEYKENLHKNPLGISVNALYAPPKAKKFRIGIEAGVSMYANDTYEVSWVNDAGEDEYAEIDEEDCFLSYNANVKYFFAGDQKRISPYLDARLGAVSFFSTRISENEDVELFEQATRFHGTSLMLGLGGGFITRIWNAVSLDINVVANRGTNTDYRSIAANDDNLKQHLNYGIKESYTPNINYKIGLLFGF